MREFVKNFAKRVTLIPLGLSILLAGCTSNQSQNDKARSEGEVVNIYCWNTEFKGIYEAYAKDLAESHNVEVNFVIITNDYSAYQTNLDEMLAEESSLIDDDKVDIFLVEADNASKYVKSEYTLDVINDIGLTQADLADQYQYTK